MSGAFLRMLVDTSIRAPVAAVLVAGALAALRVRAGAVRHASWTAVLFAMLLMPVLPYCVPAVAPPFSLAVPSLPADVDIGTPGLSRTVRIIEAAPDSDRTSSADPIPVRVDESAPVEASHLAPRTPQLALRTSNAVLTLYAVVAAAMLIRFLLGWWGAVRIARASECVSPQRDCLAFLRSQGGMDIRASHVVAAPVTVGVLKPTILLPVTWTRWSSEKLRAVLAHEVAHVHRRDLLVAFFAHLNRCLLWFHPLSWWLERTLAATAEQASDDVALSVLGERAAYAEILLDMARAVSQRRGRISWLRVGIDGSGLLQQRIERTLSGDVPQQTSAASKGVLAVSCVSAILLAAACQPSPASFHENSPLEQRDRALRSELERIEWNQWRSFANVDWDADPGPVESLEAAVRENPGDLAALQRFLTSYWVQYETRPAVGWENGPSSSTAVGIENNPLVANKVVDRRLLAARRAHILWLIDHQPDSDLAGAFEARIFPKDLAPFFPGDPIGYAQAKASWLAQTTRPDVNAVSLGHAADFLEVADKPLAEQMLLRARALEPKGPWAARLGRFYTSVLVGSEAPAGRNSMRTLSVAEPLSSYATLVRGKLGESTDEMLLTAVGWFLSRRGSRPWMGVDPAPWAESCLKRVLQMNPQAVLAHTTLLGVRSQLKHREPLWRIAPASLDAHVAALPELERFEQLPHLAQNAYGTVEDIARWDDSNLRGRLELARAQAGRYAEDTLKLAPKFRNHPNHGTAIYAANMTLSALALRDGDRNKAVDYLRQAAEAPASEELTYADDVVSRWHLIRDLVARGERQAVSNFLERMAQTNIAGRIDLRQAAAALRRGETPRWLRQGERVAGGSITEDRGPVTGPH